MMETPIPRLVLALALPTVISMLITVIYNTADTYFVSQINKSASAAVGAVFSVMSLIQAVGFGFAMGAGSLVSLKLGEKDRGAADRYASSAFFAALLLGGVVGGIGLLFLTPMLKLLGCSETMMPYAIPYARCILIAAPLSCSTFVLNNTLRSEGHSLFSMIGMSTGGILNLILDPILIFGCKMGTGGAALATAISQCVSFIILLSMFLLKKSEVNLQIRNVSRHFEDYKKIVLTGLPTVCRQGLGSVASAALNIQAVVYGDAAVAAITIANKVYMLVRKNKYDNNHLTRNVKVGA
jgi:putative MATE family efflux protein